MLVNFSCFSIYSRPREEIVFILINMLNCTISDENDKKHEQHDNGQIRNLSSGNFITELS